MAAEALDGLIDALERAGLRGHGGAFFPTATKLRAVAAQQRSPIVVVNGSEGEPLSRKDRFLLSARTELVLDGALAVAGALGATLTVIAIDHRQRKAIERVQAALARRPELARRRAPAVEVVSVPGGFVSGQETALVNSLDGGEPVPTAAPPFVFERGLRNRPTFVSNVETFSQIARVLDGSYDATRYVTVTGAVPEPVVVAVSPHTTVAAAVSAGGGVTDRVSGVLLGGYGGTWTAVPDVWDLCLDESALRARGLTLGAGIVHVLGESTCAVDEVARITRWMAGESAGQCGPCVFGLDAIAGAVEQLSRPGQSRGERAAAIGQLRRWSAMVTRRGACAHPDGVARFVTTALEVFADEFADHAAHGPCQRCRRDSAQPGSCTADRRERTLVA